MSASRHTAPAPKGCRALNPAEAGDLPGDSTVPKTPSRAAKMAGGLGEGRIPCL